MPIALGLHQAGEHGEVPGVEVDDALELSESWSCRLRGLQWVESGRWALGARSPHAATFGRVIAVSLNYPRAPREVPASDDLLDATAHRAAVQWVTLSC